ncbi:hypothetical protein [Kitasatospora sp. NPDC098663]|uniref:hypothetical protein n=1 Tax=Kitasatospora sp. NPDC098663 TaxID=3364096 RepID=UPI003829DB14
MRILLPKTGTLRLLTSVIASITLLLTSAQAAQAAPMKDTFTIQMPDATNPLPIGAHVGTREEAAKVLAAAGAQPVIAPALFLLRPPLVRELRRAAGAGRAARLPADTARIENLVQRGPAGLALGRCAVWAGVRVDGAVGQRRRGGPSAGAPAFVLLDCGDGPRQVVGQVAA